MSNQVISEWVETLFREFNGELTYIAMEFPSTKGAFQFLEELSFVVLETQGKYKVPQSMRIRIFQFPSGSCGISIGGDMSSTEIHEVLSKAKSLGIELLPSAHGSKAMTNLQKVLDQFKEYKHTIHIPPSTANDKEENNQQSDKKWWQFWK